MASLKQKLMVGVMAGTIALAPVAGMAKGASAWAGLAASAVGGVVSNVVAFKGADTIIWMPGTANTDPAQIAAEVGVLQAIKKVKYNWKPQPEKEYERAANSNGGSSGSGGGDPGVNSLTKTLGFEVGSLQNVGIEAIGVGPELSAIISTDTRTQILGELEAFQPTSGATSEEKADTGAGSCSAPYTICQKELTSNEKTALNTRQEQNQQWFGTAGIAHAELGLKSVYQAIVDDGGAIGAVGASASSEEIKVAMSNAQNVKVQDLTGLIGIAQNTVMAQKIVALMNLELAQRLNQGNMLQGSALTIDAARALRKTDNFLK